MEDSHKPQPPQAPRSTLKLKSRAVKAPAAAPPAAAPPPAAALKPRFSPTKTRDSANWADVHKDRMQAEMDALSKPQPEQKTRQS